MSPIETELIRQSIISLISGSLGAVLGGIVTYLSVQKSYDNNLKLLNYENKNKEKAVLFSIVEELKVLKEAYEKEMDAMFQELADKDFLENCYIENQDFLSVYHGNTQNIGLIKSETIRNEIIKVYIKIKKYLEQMRLYKESLELFGEKRVVFLCNYLPDIYTTESIKGFSLNTLIEEEKTRIKTLLQKGTSFSLPPNCKYTYMSL